MDSERRENRRRMGLMALLHIGCCGLPLLLLLSGVSLASFAPHAYWVVPALVVAALGLLWLCVGRGRCGACAPDRPAAETVDGGAAGSAPPVERRGKHGHAGPGDAGA